MLLLLIVAMTIVAVLYNRGLCFSFGFTCTSKLSSKRHITWTASQWLLDQADFDPARSYCAMRAMPPQSPVSNRFCSQIGTSDCTNQRKESSGLHPDFLGGSMGTSAGAAGSNFVSLSIQSNALYCARVLFSSIKPLIQLRISLRDPEKSTDQRTDDLQIFN
jgi:hypothetical protein